MTFRLRVGVVYRGKGDAAGSAQHILSQRPNDLPSLPDLAQLGVNTSYNDLVQPAGTYLTFDPLTPLSPLSNTNSESQPVPTGKTLTPVPIAISNEIVPAVGINGFGRIGTSRARVAARPANLY